jgi:hypothetical protein
MSRWVALFDGVWMAESIELDLAVVTLVYLNAVLPVATALFLTHMRSKYDIGRYALATSPFLAFALAYWMCRASVVYGPSSGFRSGALFGALASVAALCAVPTDTKSTRFGLAGVSLLITNLWFLLAGYIS